MAASALATNNYSIFVPRMQAASEQISFQVADDTRTKDPSRGNLCLKIFILSSGPAIERSAARAIEALRLVTFARTHIFGQIALSEYLDRASELLTDNPLATQSAELSIFLSVALKSSHYRVRYIAIEDGLMIYFANQDRTLVR